MPEDQYDAADSAEEGRPQLRMWDEAGQETAIGSLDDGERRWKILVIAEPVAEDLVRGWLSFRLDDEKYDTAPVILKKRWRASSSGPPNSPSPCCNSSSVRPGGDVGGVTR